MDASKRMAGMSFSNTLKVAIPHPFVDSLKPTHIFLKIGVDAIIAMMKSTKYSIRMNMESSPMAPLNPNIAFK